MVSIQLQNQEIIVVYLKIVIFCNLLLFFEIKLNDIVNECIFCIS
jgi:hypothetical protein